LHIIAKTKEGNDISALLASSDHAYPEKLKTRGLQNEFSIVLFADEFPPAQMRLLLTGFGMGKELADHCMAVCGGHVLY
jgi:hypothetical protein